MKRQFPSSLHHSCIKTCIRGIYVHVICTTIQRNVYFIKYVHFFFESIEEIDTEERHQIISPYKKMKIISSIFYLCGFAPNGARLSSCIT